MREPVRLDVFGEPLPPGALSRCGTHRLWHPPDTSLGGLFAVGFSPDSRRLVSAKGLTARVWDLEDGRERVVLSGHTDILRAALYVSTERIVTAAHDGTVRLWNAEDGTELRRWTLARAVRRLAFSPDGRTLLAATEAPDGFAVLDLERDEPLRQVCPEDAVAGTELVAFSPDGTQVFTIEQQWRAFQAARLCAFDFETGALQWAVHGVQSYLPWLHFSRDGQQVTCSFEARRHSSPMTFHTRTGTPVPTEPESEPFARCFLPDGTLVKMGDGTVELHRHGAMVREFPLPTDCGGEQGRPVPSPDGRYVAFYGKGPTLLPLEVSTGRMGPARAHRASVRDVTFSRDGSRLLTYAWDGTLRVWDCATGTQVSCDDMFRRFRARHGYIEHSCLADGNMWVSTWPDVIVDGLTGAEVEAEGGFRPYRVSWSGDAALLAHFRPDEEDRPAIVHDARTGRQLRRVPLPLVKDEARALSRSGRFMATWESYRSPPAARTAIRIWDLDRRALCSEQFPRDSTPWELRFTPDDRWFAYIDEPCTLVLVDLEHPERQRKLESPVPISAFAFSEDSQSVAIGTQHGRVRVCGLDGRLFGVLEGHRDDVRAVAFSADGRWLASGSTDTTAVIWPREAWEREGR
jgi:WD40 repeat protein